MSNLTTNELVGELQRLCSRIEGLVTELRVDAAASAVCEHSYRVSKAVSMASTSGALSTREAVAMADPTVASAHFAHITAKSKAEVTKDALFAARAQLSAWQSIAQAVRAEMELAR